MKRRDLEAKRALTAPELRAELRAAREKQFKLGFKHRVSRLENPMELRSVRRHISRLETWIRQKEAAK